MEDESDTNLDNSFSTKRADGENCENSFPSKSKVRYEIVYQQFLDWKESKNITTITEDVMINYMKELSSIWKMKPSTLWSRYSMIKSSLNIIEDFDISKFYRLRSLLKKLSEGYTSKKSHTLTAEQMHKFIREAPDREYLFTKVVLVFGINGGCSRSELKKLTTDNITDHNNELIVKIFESDKKIDRMFVINGGYYEIVKKYISLRPPRIKPFFLSQLKGKLTHQPVGINKLGNQAKIIAQYLKLENPEGFTGHCFRRTGQAILACAGSGDSQIVQNTVKKKIYGNFNSGLVQSFQNYLPVNMQNLSNLGVQSFQNLIPINIGSLNNSGLVQSFQNYVPINKDNSNNSGLVQSFQNYVPINNGNSNNSGLAQSYQNCNPVTKIKQENSNDPLYVNNIFEEDLEKKTYENALEGIGKDWMSDESQIFGNFVASELRDISNQELRRQLKLYIQKGILEFSEKDALLEEFPQPCSSNHREIDNEETKNQPNNSPKS